MYTAYFGFREKPFNVTPDPRFFYPNPVYQEAYATLLYGIRERKGFVVLTGEVGTGKTTLLRRLMDNLEPTAPFVFIYNTTMTFDELLSFTCKELGLPRKKGRLGKIQALNDFLITQLRKGGTGVLLIDEAQNLGDVVLENLRLLSNLETGSEKLLQIVLVGQPELEDKLAQPNLRQLKQRIAHYCRLDRLEHREVGPFIDYRVRAVGYEGGNLFNKEAIQRIALYSKGIPRLINIICDNALLISYGSSKKTVSAKTIEEVAQDLRLNEETQVAQVEMPTWATASGNGKEDEFEAAEDEPVQPRRRHLAWAGVGTFLVLLFLGGGAAVIYPLESKRLLSGVSHGAENFMGIVGERLESLKQDFNKWLAVLMYSESKPEKVEELPSERSVGLEPNPQDQRASHPNRNPFDLRTQAVPIPSPDLKDKKVDPREQETPSTLASHPPIKKEESSSNPDTQMQARVELILETKGVETKVEALSRLGSDLPVPSAPSRWMGNPIVIKRGTTISDIVFEGYGNYNTLAMDLIKEFNPQVENLNWIIAGEKLWVPPLTRETLLRKQPDDSYRLILASLPTSLGAAALAEAVRDKGYKVVVTPRRLLGNFSIHRVEIGRLKNLEAANQAWDAALANYWFPFAENPSPMNNKRGQSRMSNSLNSAEIKRAPQ